MEGGAKWQKPRREPATKMIGLAIKYDLFEGRENDVSLVHTCLFLLVKN